MISVLKNIVESEKFPGTYYGFIVSPDGGNDFYFTSQDTNGLAFNELVQGAQVEFEPAEEGGRLLARAIRLIESDNAPVNTSFSGLKTALIDAVNLSGLVHTANDFEDAVHLLLRLLGIHTAFQIDRENQAGKADGFFILDNLAVMYDCTLNSNFEEYKSEQIENYINQLNQKSQITFKVKKTDGGSSSKTVQITGKKRQVWIVTKGRSKEINDFDGVKVKEVSVSDLVNAFVRRVKDPSYDAERLVGDLVLLGC